MIVVMKSGTPEIEIQRVSSELQKWNVTTEKIRGKQKLVIGLVGETATIDPLQIQKISSFIEQVLRVDKLFKRVALEFRHRELVKLLYQHLTDLSPLVKTIPPFKLLVLAQSKMKK